MQNMDFQKLPYLVQKAIFSEVSPGFLWLVCRGVCKSWKFLIENTDALFEGIYKRGLLQFWVHKEGHWSHSTVNQFQIYRCTKYDTTKATVTFTPMEGQEPCTLENETIDYDGIRNSATYKSIHLGQITNSLFPGGKSPSLMGVESDGQGKVRVYNIPVASTRMGQSNVPIVMFSQQEVDEFNCREMNTASTECDNPFGHRPRMFPVELHFDRPKVYVEVLYRPYLFKCQYLTKMNQTPNINNGSGWHAAYTLIINEIEVCVADLCRWRCSCPKWKLVQPCDIQKLLNWKCPSLYPPWNGVYSQSFVEYALHYDTKTSADVQAWIRRTQEHSNPAFHDFMPTLEERKQRFREYSKSSPACAGCIQKADPYIRPLVDPRARLPAKRCNHGLCRNCCKSPECKMHRKCSECRLASWEKKEYRNVWRFYGVNRPMPPPRKCLRYFEGIECCNRVKATRMAWEQQVLGFQSVLIYKFPGRQFEKAPDQMEMK